MHDPLTVAFEIRRPWPKVHALRPRPDGKPHKTISLPFVRVLGREFYFPGLIVVWHRDPEKGGDDDSCRHDWQKRYGFKRSFWVYTLHVHHWHIQVCPAQAFRRWLLTRCAGCGRRFRYGYSPISYAWDPPRRSFIDRWTHGEEGLFHFPEHSPFLDGRPCQMMYEHENYLRWREAYPELIDGQFDRGDPIDRWLDDSSLKSTPARAALPEKEEK
jgi:hypothetical protein